MSTSSEVWQSFQYPAPGDDAGLSRTFLQTASRLPADESALNAARQDGYRQAEVQLKAAFEEEMLKQRERIEAALNHFSLRQVAYFKEVEAEVVYLALSIAKKILRREAQIDPLLLLGIVRVALEKLGSDTEVTIRFHPSWLSDWRTHFEQSFVRPPTLVEDGSLPTGECVLETKMGRTTVKVDEELRTIEEGFLDLLACRPQGAIAE